MKIALAIIITLAAPRVSLSAPVTTPVLASLDTAVERAVQTEAARARFETKEAKPRPYVRNSLIGAAAGGLILGIIGSQIDHNEHGSPQLGGYTGAYAAGGAAIGAGIGALTALIR